MIQIRLPPVKSPIDPPAKINRPWRRDEKNQKTGIPPCVAGEVLANDDGLMDNAMLDFAVKVCLSADEVGDADFETLHRHGFDDEDIWHIAAITAFFGLSNRIANVMAMRLNDEFYLIGRLSETEIKRQVALAPRTVLAIAPRRIDRIA